MSRVRSGLAGKNTYRPKNIPATITSVGDFDPLRSIYNLKPTHLRKTRAKMGAAKAGTGLCRIVCGGTSLTTGFKATTRPNVSSYPVQMRSLIAARGYPLGGTGVVQLGTWDAASYDGRWTLSGAGGSDWTTTSVTPNASGALSTVVSGATATFVADIAGTSVDVVYYNGSGAFTVAIDGAAAVTVTPSGAGNGNVVYTVTGLSNAVHTVVVTTTTTTRTFILAAQVRGASGVIVTNAGVDGSSTTSWADTNFYEWGPITAIAPYSPDLFIYEGPMNDFLNTISLATTATNLGTIINRAKTAGADVLLVADPASTTTNGTDAKWDTYRQAMYNAADTYDVPLIDLTESMGRRTTVVTNSLDNDGVHLNDAGYAAMGAAIFAALGV